MKDTVKGGTMRQSQRHAYFSVKIIRVVIICSLFTCSSLLRVVFGQLLHQRTSMGEISVMDDHLPYVGTMEVRQARGFEILDMWRSFGSGPLGDVSYRKVMPVLTTSAPLLPYVNTEWRYAGHKGLCTGQRTF